MQRKVTMRMITVKSRMKASKITHNLMPKNDVCFDRFLSEDSWNNMITQRERER